MPQVFLSYRRRDNDHALSIYLWLIKRYGRESVFWDRKDIDVGRDFSEVIEQGIEKSAVFIALVGPGWLGEPDERGRRKIDSNTDWVRKEINAALNSGVRILPVLGSGAKMPAAKDLPPDLERFGRLQASSMSDMRFYSLLAGSLEQAGFREVDTPTGEKAPSRMAVWAGSLLRRQAERLQIRAKELIRDGHTERALEELNEGIELMMALLDFVPGEQALDVQLGYIYGALAQEFEEKKQPDVAARYRYLQLGIFERVKDDLTAADYQTGEAASAIKGVGEVYAGRGEYIKAIEYYLKALEIAPNYQYAWHDLFGAYDGLAREGRVELEGMRVALQNTREFSAGPTPSTQLPGLDLEYLDSLEARLRYWEQTVAARAQAGG